MSGDNYISSPCVSCIHGINKPYVIELTDCYVFVSMINTNVLRKHKCNATSWSSQRPMLFFMTNYPWNWSHTIKNWSDKLFNYFFLVSFLLTFGWCDLFLYTFLCFFVLSRLRHNVDRCTPIIDTFTDYCNIIFLLITSHLKIFIKKNNYLTFIMFNRDICFFST